MRPNVAVDGLCTIEGLADEVEVEPTAGVFKCTAQSGALPVIDTSSRQCFATRPGTADRSSKVLKLGVQNCGKKKHRFYFPG